MAIPESGCLVVFYRKQSGNIKYLGTGLLREEKAIMTNKPLQLFKAISLYIVLFIYCTWFFLFVNKGLDITDSAYVLSLYKYIFDSNTQTTIGIALTSIIGGVLWKIIPTAQVLVLCIISAVLYTINGLLVYKMLKKYVQPHALLLMMMGASFYSITWVRVLHYNAWSMFFLTVEIFLLYKWFGNLNKNYIFWCGFLYGVNIWIRLPNCVHGICLFAVIWYIANHKKKKELWHHIFTMLLGALAGILVASLLVILVIGVGDVEQGIRSLFSIGMNSADSGNGHSFVSMFDAILSYLKFGLYMLFKWVSQMFFLCMAEYVMIKLIRKITGKNMPSIVLMGLNVCFGITYGIYVLHYQYAIETLLSFCVVLAIILSVIGAIIYRKNDICLSSLCILTCLLELVIVFGTNNGVFWNIVFLFLPLGMIACLCLNLFKEYLRNFGIILLAFVETMVILGGFTFANTYVFRDDNLENLTCTVKSDVYKGIKTTEERATLINNIEEQLRELPEGQLLNMGMCNVGSVVSNLAPVIKAWPDVRTYSYEQFSTDLDSKVKQGELPYVLLVVYEEELTDADKMKYEKIWQMIEEYQYKEVYSDEDFSLYSPF